MSLLRSGAFVSLDTSLNPWTAEQNTALWQHYLGYYVRRSQSMVGNAADELNVDRHAQLLVLSDELVQAERGWCKKNGELEAAVAKSVENRSAPILVVDEEAEVVLPLVTKESEKHTSILQVIRDEVNKSRQAYTQVTDKSDAREAQWNIFLEDFNPIIDAESIDYQAALKAIVDARAIAIADDTNQNKNNWFKLNRKGNSRYLDTLAQFENLMLRAWATDPDAMAEG